MRKFSSLARFPLRGPRRFARFVSRSVVLSGIFAVAALMPAQAEEAREPAAFHDARKKLVMLIAEPEYETARTLPAFAAEFLQKDFRVVVVEGSMAPGAVAFDGIDELADADVLLVSVRRRTPPADQLEAIRRYVKSGKPVVGIRTACHAFKLMKGTPPAGDAEWPEWDAEVIGGNYHNHYHAGSTSTVTAVKADSAILDGVILPFTSPSTLYTVAPLRAGAEALLMGTIPDQASEPLAWTFTRGDGGRTFYTSLGSPADFQNSSFTRLLRNGIYWAAGVGARGENH
jgi:type 1 glutamine amidotransferase